MPARKITAEERELREKAHRYLPGGTVGNIKSVMIREGRGGRVWDVSGNEYVDFMLAAGPMLLGHAHPEVVEAVREQAGKGSTFFADNEKAVLLAEEIVKAVPCAEKVRFSSSGSEAMMYAMRTARAYRNRDKILKFEGGYHGSSDYALMGAAPAEPPDFPQARADSYGIPRSVEDEMLIAPFNDIETTTAIIERHHEELAGVIVEPFQRLIAPRPGFLEALREVTQQYEIPLIFDEIVTGFRFAYGGAQEFYGVTPDLCALGKAVAGGYPLTAIAGKDELMAHLDVEEAPGGRFIQQVGTLSGNPVAAVAGLKTLEILRREGTYERLFATGQQIKDSLERLLNEAEIPVRVLGEAPLFEVFFTENEITDYRSSLSADEEMLRRFNRLLLERGVLKGDSKIYISVAHTAEDVRHAIQAFASAIDELKG